jgi:hypothetical protein
MIIELIKLANDLDSRGLVKEADVIDTLLKDAGLRSWFVGDGWNPSSDPLERDRQQAKKMREAVSSTGDSLEGGSYPAHWGQGGEGFHEAKKEWLDHFEKAQKLNLTVDEFRAKGRSPSVPAAEEEPDLPPSFVKQLRQLTTEQKKILGDLLMEGGPVDAGSTDLESPPAKGFLDWDKPVGSPTQSLPPKP